MSLASSVTPAPPAVVQPPVPLERALVARAARGDDRAFRLIFEEYAARVRRFALDMLRDAAAADEATQETFVRAHGALPGVRERDRLGAWLLGIARNVCRERRRDDQRQRLRHVTSPAGDDELADGQTPRELLLAREADDMLSRALAGLGEQRRVALLLRIDHDLSYDEIAALMEWPVSKVKNEIHRGRQTLRASLDRYLKSGGSLPGGEQEGSP